MLTTASPQSFPNCPLPHFPNAPETCQQAGPKTCHEASLDGVLQGLEIISLSIETQVTPQPVEAPIKVSRKSVPHYIMAHCMMAIVATGALAVLEILPAIVAGAYLAGTVATSGCLIFELQRRRLS